MEEIEDLQTMDLDDFLDNIKSRKSNSSILDIKNVLMELINRQNIDLITRIRDVELDKICIMLHHAHILSEKMSILANLDNKDKKNLIIVLCSAEKFLMRHISLRLSLDGKSRQEFENIIISLIKVALEENKQKAIEENKTSEK